VKEVQAEPVALAREEVRCMSSEVIMALSETQWEPGNQFVAGPIARIHWGHNFGYMPGIGGAVDTAQG